MRFKKEYIVNPERAAAHAAAHLHIGIATSLPGMTGWRGANLDEHTVVYDLNGEPLFYDIPVTAADGTALGMIRASAATPLGAPVASVYLGPSRWHPSRAALHVNEIITRKYKGKLLKSMLVCYAYPKLGIAVEWKKARGTAQRTIFDAADFTLVPEEVTHGLRGPGAVSIYERIPESAVAAAVEQFRLHDKLVGEIEKRTRLKLGPKMEIAQFELMNGFIGGVVLQMYETRKLTFCSHNYSHECFNLHGQQNGYYCVVATDQMILDFWRYNLTQASIATAMGTTTGGTGYQGEISGLESLTSNHFDATQETAPTFDKVKAEIQANRPFDYSYSYHAMACAGYTEQKIYILGTTPLRQVYLYDPSPVSTGVIRWETWGAGFAAVDGFVYLRRV